MVSSERQYAEDAALILESMGMTRASGKLLAWLLVCDPPQQSSAELSDALDLSAGSVSTGTRILENARLIRRVAVPGRRGKVYEMIEDAMTRAAQDDRVRIMRELMDRGLSVVGDEAVPRARRLRRTRDFYAFLEREIPALIKRFEEEYGEGERG
jgi:DNA-binding transcriptional regulator GbsR (MarR family)